MHQELTGYSLPVQDTKSIEHGQTNKTVLLRPQAAKRTNVFYFRSLTSAGQTAVYYMLQFYRGHASYDNADKSIAGLTDEVFSPSAAQSRMQNSAELYKQD